MVTQLGIFDSSAHSDRPTLYVTNWSSRKLQGPGRKWTIMAKPRRWERGDGVIESFVPDAGDLGLVRAGEISMEEYRRRFMARDWAPIGPGQLTALIKLWTSGIYRRFEVADGDTLCCACSREAAARGECHRVWAAELLHRAGWRVILDGRQI